MKIEINGFTGACSALRVDLDEGHAELMGDGMFVVFQEVDGRVRSLTLSAADLRRMLTMA